MSADRSEYPSDVRATRAALDHETRFGPRHPRSGDALPGLYARDDSDADTAAVWTNGEVELVVDALVASAAGRSLLRRKLAEHAGDAPLATEDTP